MNIKTILVSLSALAFLLISYRFITRNVAVTQEEQMSLTPTIINTPVDSLTPTSTIALLAPIPPAVGIDLAIRQITQALQAPSASRFQSLLQDDIIQGSETGDGTQTDKAAAIKWLNDHWGASRQYISKNYIPHFGYWEIETSGWSNLASGRVFFRLFKYDAQGNRTIGDGNWMIYALLY